MYPVQSRLHYFGPLSSETTNRTLVSTLSEEGVPDHDANAFAEGVRRGGTLVMVTPDTMGVDQASESLKPAPANRYS